MLFDFGWGLSTCLFVVFFFLFEFWFETVFCLQNFATRKRQIFYLSLFKNLQFKQPITQKEKEFMKTNPFFLHSLPHKTILLRLLDSQDPMIDSKFPPLIIHTKQLIRSKRLSNPLQLRSPMFLHLLRN